MSEQLTVSFNYTVGNARFGTEVEIDPVKWNEMSKDDRNDFLQDAALKDVEDMIDIEEESIDEDGVE